MTSVTADTTNNIGGEIALLRTVILAMTDLTTYKNMSTLTLYVGKNTNNSDKLGSRRRAEYRSRRPTLAADFA